MSRRVVGSTLVAASLLIGTNGALAAYQAPLADCATVKDGTSDAILDYSPVPTQSEPDPRGASASNSSVDITGVTMRVTDDRVLAYMKVNHINAFSPQEAAFEYDITIVKGVKKLSATSFLDNSNPAYDNAPSKQSKAGNPRVTAQTGATGAPADLKDVKGEIDSTRNLVVVSMARAEVEAFLGAPIMDGDQFALSGATAVTIGPYLVGGSRHKADFAPDNVGTNPGTPGTYTVGQDDCFAPAKLVVNAVKVQYGDVTTLVAALTDDTGAKLADRTVHFSVAGDTRELATATTDDEGIAKLPYTALVSVGAHAITATFGGDDVAGRGVGTAMLTASLETAKLGALGVGKAGTGRSITVTLTDDDRTPIAGQKVDWYVNGRKAGTTTTASNGKTAAFKGAKAGQTVQAKFAGVPGKYGTAASPATKV